jgi:hypothetical protein
LELIGVEGPSRYYAGEAGFYPEVIRANANYSFDATD